MSEDFGELDRLIRQFVTVKTPREIGVLVGVEPEVVIRRVQELRDEIDVLTLEEQVTFLMFRLNRIAADAENDAKGAGYEFKGGLYSAATSAIKESLRQLNVLKKSNEDAVERLNGLRFREVLRLVDEVVVRGVGEIAERFELDEGVLLGVFRSHLEGAAREVEG